MTEKRKKLALSMSASSEEPWRDTIWHVFVSYFQRLGYWPVLVPNVLLDPAAFLEALGVDGLILTGGGDIDPARYGQPCNGSRGIAPVRDATEWSLLEAAIQRRMPVFAICRGIQFLNVFFGGGLVQDIPTEIGTAVCHSESEHPVTITDPAWAARLGAAEFTVNSLHHQGITGALRAGALSAFAVSEPDGIVEGLVHSTLPILGVQWHPERSSPSEQVDLMLIRAALDGGLWA